jgi:hypothetical protein
MKRLLTAALVAVPVLLWASPALAQCAMCQTALTGSAEGRGMSAEFNRAIVVMLFAPYVVFGSIGAVLLRHRIRASLRRSLRRWRLAAGRSLSARRSSSPADPSPSPSRVH